MCCFKKKRYKNIPIVKNKLQLGRFTVRKTQRYYFTLLILFFSFSFVNAQVFIKDSVCFYINPSTITNLSSVKMVVKGNTILSNANFLSHNALIIQERIKDNSFDKDLIIQRKTQTKKLSNTKISTKKPTQNKTELFKIKTLSKSRLWIKKSIPLDSQLLSYAMRIKMAVLSFYYVSVVKKSFDEINIFLKYYLSIKTNNNFCNDVVLIDSADFFRKNYLRPPPFQA